MANKANEKRKSKLQIVMLISVIASILLVFLAPVSLVKDSLKSEMEMTSSLVGHEIEKDIYKNSLSCRDTLINQNALYTNVRKINIPFTNQTRVRTFLVERLDVFTHAIGSACYRVTSLWSWASILIPIFFAAVVDGIVRWKIKQHQFVYVSHSVHSASGGMIGLLLMLIFAGLLIPIPMPYIAAAPLGGIITFLTWNWISNLPKRL